MRPNREYFIKKAEYPHTQGTYSMDVFLDPKTNIKHFRLKNYIKHLFLPK